MGGKCSTHCLQNKDLKFSRQNNEGTDNFKDLDIDGRIIVK